MAIEIYLAVKARALKLKLLPAEAYEAMLRAPTFKECTELLSKYGYVIRDPSLEGVECAALEHMLSLVDKMIIGVDGPPGELLRAYSFGRVELELVRDALRSLAGGARYRPPRCSALATLKVGPRLLSTFKDLWSAVATLVELGYRTLGRAFEYYEEVGSVAVLEMGAEADYYARCWRLADSLLMSREVKRMVMLDSASRWLYWLAVLKFEGIGGEILSTLSKCMMPGLPRHVVAYGVERPLEELSSVARAVHRELGEAFTRGFESGFLVLEAELLRALWLNATRILRLRPIDLSYALACVLALYFEAKNVYRVLSAKIAGIPEETVREALQLL